VTFDSISRMRAAGRFALRVPSFCVEQPGPEVDTTHAEPEAQHTDRGGLTLPDRKRLEVAKALATPSRRSHGRRVKSPPFRNNHQTKRGMK
jgi:hypothetical protein